MTYGSLGKDDPQLYELAENFFRLVLAYDSTYTSAWYNLGNAFAYTGRYDQAIISARRSIELDPEFNSAYSSIAYSFRKTKAYDSSEYYYKTLLARDPNRFDDYIMLAKLYQETEDFNRAEDILRDADMLFLEHEQKIEIARTYALMNSYQRAILILREIIDSGGSPLDGYITLANLYYILDQKTDGLRILSSANKQYNDPASLLAIAETFLQLSAKDSAELYLYKSIKIYPQFTHGYQKLALFYLLRNDAEKARDVLETGMEKIQNPQDREILNSTLRKLIQN
jgi:tetratricopeptide (TPR) repeat protein